jgi:hypothetical protein
MTPVAELLRSLEGREWTDERGEVVRVRFAPPLSEAEIDGLEAEWGMPVPAASRDVLRVTQVVEGVPLLDSVNFAGHWYRDVLEALFPYTLPIATDGYGNFWSVDVLPGSDVFGPVYYVCHDGGVVLYQCADVAAFIEGMIELVEPPHQGPLYLVQKGLPIEDDQEDGNRTGGEVGMEPEEALASDDEVLRAFARSLPPEVAWIADMRNARIGQGFVTHDPEEFIRHPSEHLFARLYV